MSNISQFFFLAARRHVLTTTSLGFSSVGCRGLWFPKQEVLPVAGTRDNAQHSRELGCSIPTIYSLGPSLTFLPSTIKNTQAVCPKRKCVFLSIPCHVHLYQLLEIWEFPRENLSWTPRGCKAKPLLLQNSSLRNFHSQLTGPWFGPL